MPQITKSAARALEKIKERGREVRVLVVGDLILDRFLYGSVERISPEAPVPVVDIEREVKKPGGATNVVFNLLALGATVSVAGIVGADQAAQDLLELLAHPDCRFDGVVADPSRPTAVKSRVIAQHQQMVRFDHEDRSPLDENIARELAGRVAALAREADVIIVSDYGKTVLCDQTAQAVAASGVPFAVDPKPNNERYYRGAFVITPNSRETELLSGVRPSTDEAALKAGQLIAEKIGVKTVLVTRGEKGMTLVDEEGRARHIPTRARDVFDVTGAGDTSISVHSLAVACGADPFEAACLANLAGGLVVGKLGTATVTVDELAAALEEPVPLRPGS